MQCLICGGLRQRAIFNELGIEILECRECKHIFSSFSANPHYDGYWGDEVEEDEQFYWNRARKRMRQEFFRKVLAGRSGQLLDVGCGLGFFLKAITPYEDWKGYGYEISSAAVRYARETLGLSNIHCGPFENVDLPQNSFDLITMWDVMEHFLRPDPLLRRCHGLLKGGGICFIYTPNVHIQLARARIMRLLRGEQPGIAYLQPRDHLHHYSVDSIRKLLERNGFSHVEFLHLHPIQSLSGSKSRFLIGVKNMWFAAARALAVVSREYWNFDNLFVLAHKKS
jgi:SAM-dependent methyltransferase